MSNPSSLNSNIQQHYASRNLGEAILNSLAAAGKDTNHLRPEDLAAVDEFHIRGRKATVELAGQLSIGPQTRVLDLGSGLGGASRTLAVMFGCRVTGLDLTEEYCRTAQMLAERLGLESQVTYRHGDALEMPFEDGSFDIVWTQHTSMNIPAKAGLYAEIRRVLRPGGRLAMYDVLEGSNGPVIFPVPWAREPAVSFLLPPHPLRELLEKTGFQILHWKDTSDTDLQWLEKMEEKVQAQGGLPPLGIHLVLGEDFRSMSQNLIRNLREKRIVLIEAIAQRIPMD